eukprot:TRINITY_DN4430_c0_g2_i13.p2 TRINITY_DN4430_c0_g2~~TRINITY_DN4430_c0_g2_i13.p2  ORF type:complete len:124 (-),score=13.91 TRINITY_DN4430_c0_g2_i13:152-523(-)
MALSLLTRKECVAKPIRIRKSKGISSKIITNERSREERTLKFGKEKRGVVGNARKGSLVKVPLVLKLNSLESNFKQMKLLNRMMHSNARHLLPKLISRKRLALKIACSLTTMQVANISIKSSR